MVVKLDKTKLVRNLAVKHKFVTFIERALDEGEFEWDAHFEPKVKDDAWHPSGDCTPSLNDLYWSALQDSERVIPVSLRKTFIVGHFWHAYIQYIAVEKAQLCSWENVERRGTKILGYHDPCREIGVKPFHWATGAADIAPAELPGHGPYLIDIKTMGSHDFKRQGPPEWAVAKWECQINIYMDWFDLEHALIVGVQKDSPHDFREWTFHRNQPLIDTIYRKWRIVSECLDEKIEPPLEETIALPLAGCLQ